MCNKSRNTWLCVHWQWNTLEWRHLNALVNLVIPFSYVSLSMNTQPSVPVCIRIFSWLFGWHSVPEINHLSRSSLGPFWINRHNGPWFIAWASCQIRTIASCACAENAGNISPATDFKWNCELAITARASRASRHVRHARAVMHVGIASPQWRGKRSRHSPRMHNPQFYVSGKRPMHTCF